MHRAPDTRIQYSGGGFLLLQLVLELVGKAPIADLLAPWLRAAGLADDVFVLSGTGIRRRARLCAAQMTRRRRSRRLARAPV